MSDGVTSKVPSGIRVLDNRLGGGFPLPSTILLFSEIPSEKRLFAEQFIINGVKNGETCLYIDFYRAPQLARRDLFKFGNFPQDKLLILDATSSQLLVPSQERYFVRDMSNLDHIMEAIEHAILEARPKRIIVDSMEFITDRFPSEDVLTRWKHLVDVAREAGSLLCFLFINWTYKEAEMRRVDEMSDFILEFQSTMKGGILRNTFRLRETKAGGLKTNWIPYTFRDLTGLTISFPRIMVTGPFNAGKSTVVRSLCTTSVSVDRMGTTVAFDYGSVDMMGLEAEILGTPGQERFEFIFKIFAREVSGVMLVVDSTRPQDFERGRQMLSLIGRDIPYVILANKSDLPGSLPVDEIREFMGLDESIPIIHSVATTGKNVREALQILAEMIIGVR